MNKHYNGLQLLSYTNAIFYFLNTTRNFGKTWNFKYRAVKRALKHGKKTLWIRRFKKEAKECVRKFFASKDLQKFCGVSFYDKETNPTGNLKQIGNTFCIKKGKKWIDFLHVVALSDVNSMRSSDDVDIDTIIFDEYTTTPHKYNTYRGNEVADFIDIFISTKRNHDVKCIFLGNKESHNNPYFNYFNILSLPDTFDGFKCFRNGAIVVEQRNNLIVNTTDYEKQVNNLLKNTQYGDYLYDSKYKENKKIKICKPPTTATCYCQFHFGKPISVYIENGKYYVTNKIQYNLPVYSQVLSGKYPHEKQLFNSNKKYFNGLMNAIFDNRLYYSTHEVAEDFVYIKKWLGSL